jgi:ATP-dependent protease Clp ATPase subunit
MAVAVYNHWQAPDAKPRKMKCRLSIIMRAVPAPRTFLARMLAKIPQFSVSPMRSPVLTEAGYVGEGRKAF